MSEIGLSAMWFVLGGLLASALIFFIGSVKAWRVAGQKSRAKVQRWVEAIENVSRAAYEHAGAQDECITALVDRLDAIECWEDDYEWCPPNFLGLDVSAEPEPRGPIRIEPLGEGFDVVMAAQAYVEAGEQLSVVDEVVVYQNLVEAVKKWQATDDDVLAGYTEEVAKAFE